MEWKKIANLVGVPLIALVLLALCYAIKALLVQRSDISMSPILDIIVNYLIAYLALALIYSYAGYRIVRNYQVYVYGAAVGATLGFANLLILRIIDGIFLWPNGLFGWFSPHSPTDVAMYLVAFLLGSIQPVLFAMVTGQIGGLLVKRGLRQDYPKTGSSANYGEANFKSMIKVASIPVIANIVLDLLILKTLDGVFTSPLATIAGLWGYLLVMSFYFFPIFLLIKSLILIGSGYFAVKKYGLSLMRVAIIGAIVGAAEALCFSTLIPIHAGLLSVLLPDVMALVIFLVCGAVMAVIGGLIAREEAPIQALLGKIAIFREPPETEPVTSDAANAQRRKKSSKK